MEAGTERLEESDGHGDGEEAVRVLLGGEDAAADRWHWSGPGQPIPAESGRAVSAESERAVPAESRGSVHARPALLGALLGFV